MLRVVHPNRWFFWTVAALVILGLVMVGYIQLVQSELDERSAELAAVPGENLSDTSYLGWKVYRSEGLGLSVKYPPDWQIEIDPLEAGTVFLENPKNFSENVSISVVSPELESVIRNSLKIAREEVVEVDGQGGQWLYGVEAEDAATSNVVLIQVSDRLYYLGGSAEQFEKIVQGVNFLDD